MEDLGKDIYTTENLNDVFLYLESLNNTVQCRIQNIQTIASELIDVDVLNEIKSFQHFGNTFVYFGKTLRDIKIVIEDNDLRKHEIYMKYLAPKKLEVSAVNLAHTSLKNSEYECLKHIVDLFQQNISELSRYFYELENIDQCCTVMEPINGTFKEDYRRIFLDDRTWLHVEVSPEGLATNIHLVGQSEYWHNKLQTGLLKWDHDQNIVDNIMHIFEINHFPQPTPKQLEHKMDIGDKDVTNADVCGICLCADLPDTPGLPLPLCQSPSCGVYYHRTCLYQWLVACAGSRPPAFGVANGACPTCLQPITCSEKDS